MNIHRDVEKSKAHSRTSNSKPRNHSESRSIKAKDSPKNFKQKKLSIIIFSRKTKAKAGKKKTLLFFSLKLDFPFHFF